MKSLRIKESSKVLYVVASRKWNPSKVLLEKGGSYKFQVYDVDGWQDKSLPATPADGISDPPGWMTWTIPGVLRRFRNANWFVLIGSIEKRHDFIVGGGGEITSPADGEVLFFANDAPGFYGNNHGILKVKISRLT